MRVIGINFGGHDTSAALMEDGNLIAACEQERYDTEKHSKAFPLDAIKDCLRLGQTDWDGVDEIAFAFDPIHHINEAYLHAALIDQDRIPFLIDDIERIRENYFIENRIRRETQFEGQVSFYNHHLCHLASTYFPSGFKDSVVASYDGIGEIESGLLATGTDGRINVFSDSNRYPDSLGLLYSAVTFFLGWKHHCDEGIVMGLATYGNPHSQIPGRSRTYYDVFQEIVTVTGEYTYSINRDWISYHKVRDRWVSDLFYETFGPKRAYGESIEQHHMDIAAALQLRLEEVVLSQLKLARTDTGLEKLCLSGGVALNCSMNGKVEQARIFDEIFVQPASGDAGVAVGACYLSSQKRSEIKPMKYWNFYLGSKFDNSEIEQAFELSGLKPIHEVDIFARTAERLSEGKIVAWFQGRAEFGPRALGNRSILTRPYPGGMKDFLNERVKFRETFRPFAPAVIAEEAAKYFKIKQESPHMLIACQATAKGSEVAPATVHTDNSCRVQTVSAENNDRFFKLLKAFFSITGCPILLNTSFNVKGQPIVNTPDEAIACFLGTNIDCLIIGDYFIEKD